LANALSVLRRCKASDYPFGIFKLLLAIALSVLLRCMDSDYPFGIFWALCCLFFFDVRLLTTPLVSSYFWPLCFLVFDIRILTTPLGSSYFWQLCCVLLRCTHSDNPFGIFLLLVIASEALHRRTDNTMTNSRKIPNG
jgi:hypothetical protein